MSNSMFKYQLNSEELGRVQVEYTRKRKQPLAAWLLLPVTGWLGGHRFYLGDYTGGFLRVVYILFLAAAAYTLNYLLELELFYIITGAGSLLAITIVIDAVLLPAKISQVNNRIEADIIIKILQRTGPHVSDGDYNWLEQKNTGG